MRKLPIAARHSNKFISRSFFFLIRFALNGSQVIAKCLRSFLFRKTLHSCGVVSTGGVVSAGDSIKTERHIFKLISLFLIPAAVQMAIREIVIKVIGQLNENFPIRQRSKCGKQLEASKQRALILNAREKFRIAVGVDKSWRQEYKYFPREGERSMSSAEARKSNLLFISDQSFV